MDRNTSNAVEWLLASDEPGVRLQTRRDVLGEDVRTAAPDDTNGAHVLSGPKVSALLSGQHTDGGFGTRPYRKWTGAHWRLVSMVELGVPPDEPRAAFAADRVLDWLTGGRQQVTVIDGLVRHCASVEGNALAASCRLGLADDPRAQRLAQRLVSWQWPDGGWNCDREASGRRSSFHETLCTTWGLHEYGQATGDTEATAVAHRAAELFLEHRIFRRLGTGDVIDRRWLRPRYPSYWHYDNLQALLVLSRMGLVDDPRTEDALDELERRRHPDGRWRADGQWWKAPDSPVTPEVVDWGISGQPNEMITLNALRVLRAANRLST